MFRLPLPYRTPCISDTDFQVALPAYLDDDEIEVGYQLRPSDHPRPIGYHIAMCRIATLYHRFRSLLLLGPWSSIEHLNHIHNSDEELAKVLEQLPRHLRPDESETTESRALALIHPWINHQTRHLTWVFFYRRITINRVLQNAWFVRPDMFAGPRAICVLSARSLIYAVSKAETNRKSA